MQIIVEQPKWKKVEYSKSAIIKAGKSIKKEDLSAKEIKDTSAIIDNWRAAHAFPLHVIYMHLRRMAQEDTHIIVAERLKRLDSIIAKLKREPTMSLWTMQDLGGCRFVVNNISDVYDYSNQYELSSKRHILMKTYDYIKYPKSSGYRSLHKVYKYHSDKKSDYNDNMLIEIQFRTHLQHLWATAVETMGLFTKQAIKSGQGNNNVKRFFILISSLFAILENQPVVPNTSNDIHELVEEIKFINKEEKYLEFLRGISVAVDVKKENLKKNGYYLLVLNYNTSRLQIKHFQPSLFEEANNIYNQIESTRSKSNIDTVLVRVDSFQSLKSAYPNYFSDIGEFISIVQKYISKCI